TPRGVCDAHAPSGPTAPKHAFQKEEFTPPFRGGARRAFRSAPTWLAALANLRWSEPAPRPLSNPTNTGTSTHQLGSICSPVLEPCEGLFGPMRGTVHGLCHATSRL